MIGCQYSFFVDLAKIKDNHIITNTLKIADHTIVPAPRLLCPHSPKIINNAKILVNSSGALLPMAINVAQVISEDILSFAEIFSNAVAKNAPQTMARKYAQRRMIKICKIASMFQERLKKFKWFTHLWSHSIHISWEKFRIFHVF
ncbi:hypothetical protein KKG31_01130 [Patescibacteria group bacterium]|nr:hypothetical protein [Patescibacteria group bacterium]